MLQFSSTYKFVFLKLVGIFIFVFATSRVECANDLIDNLLNDSTVVRRWIVSHPTAKDMLFFLKKMQPQTPPFFTPNLYDPSQLNSTNWSVEKQQNVINTLVEIDAIRMNPRFADAEKYDLGIAIYQVATLWNLEYPFLKYLLQNDKYFEFRFYLAQTTRALTLEKVFLHLLTTNKISIHTFKGAASIIVNRLNQISILKILSILSMRNPSGLELDIKSKYAISLFIQKTNQQKSTELFSAILMKIFSTPEGFKHNQDLLVYLIEGANPEQLGKVLLQMKIVKDPRTVEVALDAIDKRIQEYDSTLSAQKDRLWKSFLEISAIDSPQVTKQNADSTLLKNPLKQQAPLACYMIYRKELSR